MRVLSIFLLLSGACVAHGAFAFFDSFLSFFKGRGVSPPVVPIEAEIKLSEDAVLQHINNAKDLILTEDFDKAINVLLPLIDNNPDDKDANMLLGSTFLALNRADLAETFLHHAVKLTNWMDVGPISNLAEAIRLNGDLPLAAKVLQRGYVSLNNTDPSGQLAFEFGTIQEQLQNYTSAADWYLSSALSDNRNTRAWLKASTLLFPNNQWDLTLAENVLATAVKTKPNDAQLLFNLGVVMHYTSRVTEATILYTEALKFDENHYAAISNLATAFHSLGRTAEAEQLYQQVYEATKSSVPGEIFNPFSGTAIALGNYALLLSSQKKSQQSVAMVTRALLLEPESLDLLSVRERCLEQVRSSAQEAEQIRLRLVEAITSGAWDSALETLSAAGVPSEDDAWWYFTKGMLHYFRGENELALEHCTIALDHSSSYIGSSWMSSSADEAPARVSHMIHGCIGVSNQYLGRHAAAAASFAQSLETLRYMTPSEDMPRVRIHILPVVGFSMNEQDVTFNLLIAFRNAGRYSECVAEGFRSMSVNPDFTEGAALQLMFSFVDWTASPALLDSLSAVEKKEIATGRLRLPEGATLLSEIKRIQHKHMGILTPTFDCFDSLAETTQSVQAWRDHSSNLVMQATTTNPRNEAAAGDGVVLITQYFHAENEVARDNLVSVLSKNLHHPNIAEVALVNELEYNFAALKSSEKVKQYISGRRLTFADTFRVANDFYPNRTIVVSNSDIFFDSTINVATSSPLSNTIIALSKWNAVSVENSENGTVMDDKISLSLRADSQDAWVFRTPVPESVIAQSEFYLGAPRCDNRIARIFADAGYRVVNPAFSLHAIEKSSLDVRRALMYGVEHAVRGPTALVLLSDASVL